MGVSLMTMNTTDAAQIESIRSAFAQRSALLTNEMWDELEAFDASNPGVVAILTNPALYALVSPLL